MTETTVITKGMVEQLSNENITRKEYQRIISLIALKVDEIWRFILGESDRNLDWYAFRNDVSYGHGNGSSGGEFDPIEDKEWIEMQGDFDECDVPGYLYNDGFPTFFLWDGNGTAYKKVVRNHLKEIKKKDKEAKKKAVEEKKQKMIRQHELKQSILKKLTPEEASIIVFVDEAKVRRG